MKREDEHSKVASVELEIGDSTHKDMEDTVLVCNSEQIHLKGGVQYTKGVASTNLKGEGTSLNFVDSPVHMNTSTLNVDAIPYTRGVARGGAAGYICPRAPRYRGAKMRLTKLSQG